MGHPSVPTYDDARLILKLYELRREEKMRAARDWYVRKFFPRTVEDVRSALAQGSPESAYLRMVAGYWDMAASFVVAGILNADLFFESAGEMLLVWTKIQPFLADLRRETPNLLANVEKAIAMVPRTSERIERLRLQLSRSAESATAAPATR